MASLLSSTLTLHPRDKVNVRSSTVATFTLSTRKCQPFVRTGRSHGCYLPTRAKLSVGADLLAKNSVSIESVADKDGTFTLSTRKCQPVVRTGRSNRCDLRTRAKLSVEADLLAQNSVSVESKDDFGVVSIHHVGILCENLERSLDFYQNLLGLKINEARPHDKLPYRGAWLWVGSEMIHLMELPNPDPLTGRPEHGGRDRHACIAIRDVSKLKGILDKAGIPYTLSRSGRPAIFTRDPDANALEFTQVDG